jgi:ABC-type branched-subunit amino acid transport system substrate-binding protein
MANDLMDRTISRRQALKGMVLGGAALGLSGGLGSVLAACSPSAPSGPIKVGVLTDVTGAFGVVGKSNVETAQFTIDEINAAGGVLGRQLQAVVVDSASDTSVAATAARQLIEKDKVDFVIGTVTSATREAVKGIIATTGKTLLVIPTSYEGGDCTQNMWVVGAVPNQQVDPMVAYALGKSAKTWYLCGADYLYPRNMLKEVKAQVAAAGGTIVGEDYYALTATDVASIISKALAAKADAIFDVTILPLSVQFVKGVVGGGFKGIHMSPLYDEGVNSLFGPDVAGIISVQDFFSTGTHDDFTTKEMAAYAAKYPKGIFASSFNSAAWYRGIYMWKLAAEKAGSTDLAKVNATFDSIKLDKGFGGAAAMKPGTRHCTLPMQMGEMQADGSVKIIKDLGTIDPTGQCA